MAAALPPTGTAPGRIRYRRAAAESTRPPSGQVSFGAGFPKVVTLLIGVGHVGLAYPQDVFQEGSVGPGRPAQLGPVLPPAPGDDVVDGRQTPDG